MTRRHEILMWVGLFAAPCAFAFEHVVGWGVSEANCETVGRQWGIAFPTWEWVLTSGAAATAAAGLVSATVLYVRVKGTDNDEPPPVGRLWLMSICGIVVSSLLLILILLTGSGALLLGHCHQG